MSVQAMSWVIDNSKQNLGAFVVLLMVANHARSDGTGAWPSVGTLAKECRMSERQVQYSLRILERSGELKTDIGGGPNGTNLYSLPHMWGAQYAPGGAQGVHNAAPGGCKLRQEGVHNAAPEPSLTVLTDKERMEITLRAIQETEQDKSKNKRSADERRKQYLEEAVQRWQ